METSDNPFLVIGDTRHFWVVERLCFWILQGEDQRGRVGGFPEPERAVRGAPEALRVLRGKFCRRGRTYRRGRDCRRGRELDYNV